MAMMCPFKRPKNPSSVFFSVFETALVIMSYTEALEMFPNLCLFIPLLDSPME